MIFRWHLSPRENRILILCLFLIFIYISYNFIFQPLRKTIADFETRIKVSEKRLRNNLKMMRMERVVDEEYDKYSSYFKQKVSDEQAMAAILSEIESVANEINMRVADMKPKKAKRTDFYNYFSATLTIEGELATVTQEREILKKAVAFFAKESK